MSMQVIYRIEDKNTKSGPVYEGPYFNSYGGAAQWRDRPHDTRKHPNCDEDEILVKNFNKKKFNSKIYKYTDFYCGFINLEQLIKWFNKKERRNLETQGFILAAYEADIVVYSNKQALFIPKKGNKRKILKMPL